MLEYIALKHMIIKVLRVGVAGFEPTTSTSRT
jgi:hypothetical protein